MRRAGASPPDRDRTLHPEPAPTAPPPEACVPGPDGSCSICGDEGLLAEVLEVPHAGVARVRYERPAAGTPPAEVATDLLEEVRPGDRLVVHLGFAIARVREESNGPTPNGLTSGEGRSGTSPAGRGRGGVR